MFFILGTGEQIPVVEATPIQISQSIALITKKMNTNFVKHFKYQGK
jgi:hypothetical protein